MARWMVKGALRSTGENVAFTVNATSSAQAEERANRRGVLVENVDIFPGPPKDYYLALSAAGAIVIGTSTMSFIQIRDARRQIADV